MSAFALSGLAVATKKLNEAIEKIETYCEHDGAANVAPLMGDAFAALLRARGEVAAVRQLLQMQHDLESADTERPVRLRVVK